MEQQELTRAEYLQLLYTAKTMGREREYFIMKAICCIGLKIGELPQLTAEMVKAGEGILISKGTERQVYISESIQKELLGYMERKGILEGAIFRSRNGTATDRIAAFNMIRDIAEKANVPAEKCSPKSLRAIYLQTQKEIHDGLDYIAKQMYEQLLAAEEMTAGWEV